MGTQCDNYPPKDPDTTNHCNDYDGRYAMEDFCSLGGSGGKGHRKEWCGKLGNEEWGVLEYGGTGKCHYNDCKPYQVLGTGCCKGCCGIVGGGVTCTRQKFKGNPLLCCLQDKVCDASAGDQQAPASCFSDTAKKNTCSPCNRDVTSDYNDYGDSEVKTCQQAGETPCKSLVYDYCSGADMPDNSDTDWMDRWYDPATGIETPNGCINAVRRNLYKNLGCAVNDIPNPIGTGTCTPFTSSIPPSTSGTVWSRELMTSVFDRYKKNGFVIGALPGTIGYNPFQEFLYQTCCAFPVICQDALTESGSIYTKETLTYNPVVSSWFGCYLPKREYSTYENDYHIEPACTPPCNKPNVIPLVKGDGTPQYCDQTVCIIDDITIGLSNSTVTGGVNITQICGSCTGGSSCTCILRDDTIEGAEAAISGGINLTESCSSTQCNVSNPTGGEPSVLTVPCSEVADPNSAFNKQLAEIEKEEAKAQRNENLIRIAVLASILIIIVLLFIVIRPQLFLPDNQDVILEPKGLRKEKSKVTKTSVGSVALSPGSLGQSTKAATVGSVNYVTYL